MRFRAENTPNHFPKWHSSHPHHYYLHPFYHPHLPRRSTWASKIIFIPQYMAYHFQPNGLLMFFWLLPFTFSFQTNAQKVRTCDSFCLLHSRFKMNEHFQVQWTKSVQCTMYIPTSRCWFFEVTMDVHKNWTVDPPWYAKDIEMISATLNSFLDSGSTLRNTLSIILLHNLPSAVWRAKIF